MFIDRGAPVTNFCIFTLLVACRRGRQTGPLVVAMQPDRREPSGLAQSSIGRTQLTLRIEQEAARADKALNPSAGFFAPADVEGVELGKELKLAVRQVIVYPPRHLFPMAPFR